ncbi:GntR family transcriptional regulator [Citrobacter rodentium]|jgi:Transcriptional regulators|uniref:GntR-family transcriptional regulator n=2 Tax=Citrobacter rodentium TaxID=67825 RepID=D2TUG0_CITRI|nr:GntR family transcriptional regulator [Citrobacter rodentium]KIQ53231.1 GntR family transcriptional regulator [Citrobacter rodentium]QBY27856.1 GntR family transcriptional regulator [Citrobacter rodentium]UHO30257.1 GntR family transcriptional regulator [Citrobacter rodentium NBRC 105723 = DSM 16636]CBG88013.1 GntR-family transcriptional regulator [Citrobacter rodentium ICC168]HAT8013852.1 GntR family transcriptional regulator [Citrobacter rodentium NBRC 105723 = DSM 16636]
MKISALTERISQKIIALIDKGDIAPGSHLSVPKLAETFDVSRSPVREALVFLEQKGVLFQKVNRGFFVKEDYKPDVQQALSDELDLPEYYQMAEDWLQDKIDSEVTELFLMKRYNLTKSQLATVLARGISEGWVERKQGYGWRFLAVAKTKAALEQIFSFRMVIEPMAILEPTFNAPQEKINEIRRELEMLLENGIERLSPTQLQLAGYRFHETVISFSNNPFFEISLRNVNRMRRLMDYRIMDDRNRYYAEVKDHLRILSLIESGQRIEASYTMKQHLAVALDNKKMRRISADS